jgi:hypothetical protein
MKLNKSTVFLFILLIASAFLRLIPDMPAGLMPQAALALMGGALIKERKWAFVLPILSLFISDLAFYFLHNAGLTDKLGFYKGQWGVYLAFAAITLFGFLMKKVKVLNIFLYSIAASVFFFLVTNYITWEVGVGFGRPKTFEGLMQCYGDGLLFYRQFGLFRGFDANFMIGDLAWCFVLYGSYAWFTRSFVEKRPQLA